MEMGLPKRYIQGLSVIDETLDGEQTVNISQRSIPEESMLISKRDSQRV